MIKGENEWQVFGPPGTGKTTHLSSKIKAAAEKSGGERIMVSSFPRTAAKELTGRELPIPRSNVGTLHSFCFRMLGNPTIAESKIKEFNEKNPNMQLSTGAPDVNESAVDMTFQTESRPDLLNGVTVITGRSDLTKRRIDGSIVSEGTTPFTAIPYYAWAHRGRGQMTVWPARRAEATRPKPAETLAHISKTTASFSRGSLDAIKDQMLPARSSDTSTLHLDFRPHRGTTEWLLFEWDHAQTLSSVKVYWYANGRTPSPGHSLVRDPNTWPRLERYVKDIITTFKDDPRVWVWDLYNEPTNGGLGDTSMPLVAKTVTWAREIAPSQPK